MAAIHQWIVVIQITAWLLTKLSGINREQTDSIRVRDCHHMVDESDGGRGRSGAVRTAQMHKRRGKYSVFKRPRLGRFDEKSLILD